MLIGENIEASEVIVPLSKGTERLFFVDNEKNILGISINRIFKLRLVVLIFFKVS